MKYLDLREKIKFNVFSLADVLKYFSQEGKYTIKTQLSRFIKKGLITKIKRELYCFDQSPIDEMELANILYEPSYVSLETALNYYGIIPDVPQVVTCVTLTTTKKITTVFGVFYYRKIKSELFFGFKTIPATTGHLKIASKEKALLDYFYIRKIKSISDLRLNFKDFNFSLYKQYVKSFPDWVQKIKLK